MTGGPWPSRILVTAAVTVATVALAVRGGEAHKPITSKYTFNDDVFPILRDKCGKCHVEGGVAPMSLMTYDDAFPWAESIRVELIASHMPPGNALPGFGTLKHASLLTAAELDTVLTWATGGNPRGALERQPPKVSLNHAWALGPPDLVLPLPDVAIPADKMELTQVFTVATDTTEAHWLRAADLLPGTPSVVRSAVITIKDGTDAAFSAERVLRHWLPGQDVESVDRDGAAFKLPSHAVLTVQVHYKKTWQAEGQSPQDKSSVGLYFSPSPREADLLTVPIDGGSSAIPADHKLTFTRTLERDVRALAVTPEVVPPNITLTASAIFPDGRRTPLLRIHTRADWTRRYWFEQPLVLPAGTKVEVVADFDDPDQLASEAFGGFAPPKESLTTGRPAIRVSLDITAG